VAEDKQINLFYLRDQLLRTIEPQPSTNEGNSTVTDKSTCLSFEERLNALSKIKQNMNLPIFKFAVEPLLKPADFAKLKDLQI
jgi:hypothetical protein